MSGSAVNGNIPEAIITGGKDPGSSPGRATHGNQDTGKTIKMGINGTKGAGRDNTIP